MIFSAQSRPGTAGGQNEDSHFAGGSPGVFVVSDGVGRHGGGDVASRLAVETFARALAVPAPAVPAEPRDWLTRAFRAAVREVFAKGQADPGLRDMCATLTALHLAGGEYRFIHVGDSRIYRLRDSTLTRLTKDHSVAQEQLDAGAISEEQMQTHPNQRLLTRTICASRDYALPDTGGGGTRPGDVFLVCTDGVNKVLLPGEIARAMQSPAGPGAACNALLDAVDRKGRKDDTTAIVVCAD